MEAGSRCPAFINLRCAKANGSARQRHLSQWRKKLQQNGCKLLGRLTFSTFGAICRDVKSMLFHAD
jgi:hypothetical protein